eukprot:TRINITY_DN186_c0_g1_i2.p1 TRINITY_DN186_c0_g1~~TRINITY_DN186_c0_g1_i2.p1  ORF type:complete len:685 (-),score=281.86 TRINITY_DN186_c0_g1_i2:76-2130(-)
MDSQTDNEKIQALRRIFTGRDMTESVISQVLRSNKGSFDATVDALLQINEEEEEEAPTYHQQRAEQVQPAPVENNNDSAIDARVVELQRMFGGDMTRSIIRQVVTSNDTMDGAVDELLNMTSEEVAHRPGSFQEEKRRQEEELKRYEDWKRTNDQRKREEEEQVKLRRRQEEEQIQKALIQEQQRLQQLTELRRKDEEAARQAQLQAAREEEKRQLEEAKRMREAREAEYAAREQALQQRLVKEKEDREKLEITIAAKVKEEEAKLAAMTEAMAQMRAKYAQEEEARKLETAVELQKQQKEREEASRMEMERLEKQRLEAIETQRRAREAEQELIRMEHEEIKQREREIAERLEEMRKARAIREAEEAAEQKAASMEASIAIITPSTIEEVPAAVVADTSRVAVIDATVEGDSITGTWRIEEGMPTPSDWIGLFPAHQPSNTKYVQSQYINPNSSALVSGGTFAFKAVRSGRYVLRFFQNKSYTAVASFGPLVVGIKVQSLEASVDGDLVNVKYVLESPSPYPNHDWVGVFEKGSRNKRYMVSAYGNKEGQMSVRCPRQAGEYEVRLFLSNAQYNEQATQSFVVLDKDSISIVDTPATVAPGQALTVQYTARTVEPCSSDWVGLYAVTQPNNKTYLDSKYTTGQSNGTLTFTAPQQPGPYEFRLFVYSVGKYTLFRKSASFTVV